MPTVSSNEFTNVTANANYPNNNGIRFGLASQTQSGFFPVKLLSVNLMLAGTYGTSPSATVQVMDRNGNWINTPLTLSAVGQVAGTVEGCSVRAAINPGTSPGTGANAPRFHLGVDELQWLQTGEYTG